MTETSSLDEDLTPYNPLIINHEALRSDYIPETLPHREKDIKDLVYIWRPLVIGRKPSNALIFGITGTGKTVVVQYVAKEVEKACAKYNWPLTVLYVNCRVEATPYQIARKLCFGMGIQTPVKGLDVSSIFKLFLEAVLPVNHQMLVILDEIEQLAKAHSNLVYQLLRINEFIAERGSKTRLSICGITNDIRFKDYLDASEKSSLSQEELLFHPYNADQIRDIVSARSKIAFAPGTVTDAAIGLIAALSAMEHGDARCAIDLLRVSGQIAEKSKDSAVDEKHIHLADDVIERNKVRDLVVTLPLHAKFTLTAILLAPKLPIITGEVYETYLHVCEKSAIAPLTQRRVSGIIKELDQSGVVNAKKVSFGRGGTTKQTTLAVSKQHLTEMLETEPRIGPLLAEWRRT